MDFRYKVMRNLVRSFALITMAVWLVSSSLEAAVLHAIIVCDTTADNIGSSVEADLRKIHLEVSRIAANTDLTLNEKKFSSREVNENVLNYIESQTFSSDDVVFFFFSGHGYRTDSKQGNIWPYLFFTPIGKGVDFSTISQSLAQKQPHLMIAIADCCNNVIPEFFAPPTLKKKHLALALTNNLLVQNYRELFLNHSGSIIISSSKPGELSWGTRSGGIFTLAFFESMDKEIHGSQQADWQVILSNASLKVIKRDLGQTPQFEIVLD